jgi:hypothetical protein
MTLTSKRDQADTLLQSDVMLLRMELRLWARGPELVAGINNTGTRLLNGNLSKYPRTHGRRPAIGRIGAPFWQHKPNG